LQPCGEIDYASRVGSGERRGRVLVVDDEDAVRRAFVRVLSSAGYEVSEASSVAEALRMLGTFAPDVVVSDITMPGADGTELLRILSAADLDLPVIFLTGAPSVETASRAVEYGAFRYLTKPIANDDLKAIVQEAFRTRLLAQARDALGGRAELEKQFRAALEGMWMATQPIVAVGSRETHGYELLMRSEEPSLPHPGAVIDAAEKLGAVHVLGRHTRKLVAAVIDAGPRDATYFVNVHPADLGDVDLFDVSAPLARHAHRVVLELTERATLEGVADLSGRLDMLRALRYRLAIDDLGAGYAGLSYFASLSPDMMKVDMSLVRGIDGDAVKQRVVLSLTTLGRELGIEVVAEGVETRRERDELVRLGCDYLQGFGLARPGRPFPTAVWDT
jgi:EAL domain-containing protein (putative c-di-GMP-specific phosphodiesterase class I)